MSVNNLIQARKEEHEFYNKDYAKATLDILLAQMEDLSLWSAYNEDKYNDLIVTITQALEGLRKAVDL